MPICCRVIDQLGFFLVCSVPISFGESFSKRTDCYLCVCVCMLGDVDKPCVTNRRRVNGESSPAAPVLVAQPSSLYIWFLFLIFVSCLYALMFVCQVIRLWGDFSPNIPVSRHQTSLTQFQVLKIEVN